MYLPKCPDFLHTWSVAGQDPSVAGPPPSHGGLRRPASLLAVVASVLLALSALVFALRTSDADATSSSGATAASTSTITTFAGSVCSPAQATEFGLAPVAVAPDALGGYFVADSTYSVVCHVDQAGTAGVVAGNGAFGYLGDNGPATAAELYSPAGLAPAADGTLYIADRTNQRIRRVDPMSGVITTVAGTGVPGFNDGASATAVFNYPAGLALDPLNRLYIADTKNNRVRRLDLTSGTVTTVAGTGSPTYSGDGGPAVSATLSFPTGVALDTDGSLLIADANNQRIRRVDATGTITTVAGTVAGYAGDGGSAIAARLNHPQSVASSIDGVYIADSGNNRLRKVDRSGVITTVVGSGAAAFSGDGGPATAATVNFPMGVAFSTTGQLLIADSGNQRVRSVGADGVISTVVGNGTRGHSGDGGPATGAELNEPIGVAVAPDGSVIVADSLNHVVRRVTTSGIIQPVAGTPGVAGDSGDGGAATSAHLEFPTGVAVDKQGVIYVADNGNDRVRKVGLDGRITTVAGVGVAGFSGDGGPAPKAALNGPTSIAVGSDGTVFVTDSKNNRVRQVRSGIITTVAGTGAAGFSGDGGAASKAMLNAPNGVAVDSRGSLFIADTNNQRIRAVDLKRLRIRTVAGSGAVGYSGDGVSGPSALFNFPTGVVADGSGNVYVADKGNCVVRKITNVATSPSTVSTVVGWPPVRSVSPVCGFAGEGTPPRSGGTMLDSPTGLAYDSSGGLLIADSLSNRVRRVTAIG